MNRIVLFYKLCWKFLQRYFLEYFVEYIKPFLLFCLSLIFIPLCKTSPVFAIFAFLITIPVCCYTIWKMYLINYAIIPASYIFLKKGASISFKDIVKSIDQKSLISFLLFTFFLSLGVSFVFLLLFFALQNNMPAFFILLIAIWVFLLPFCCLYLQAFYFKKEKENYFDIIKKCYSKVNIECILIIISYAILSIIANIIPVISIFISVFVLPIAFISIFTFWYYSRLDK